MIGHAPLARPKNLCTGQRPMCNYTISSIWYNKNINLPSRHETDRGNTLVLLTGEHLSKAFTGKKLLDDTGFSIGTGDKVGIIGVNGTGKTTMLRILAGEETLDGGNLLKASGLRIGYLPQNPDFEQDCTVLQQVLRGVSGTQQAAKEYECKTILTKLELFDYDAKIHTLSGGQKKACGACVGAAA